MSKCCESPANREVVTENISTQLNSGIKYKVVSKKTKCKVCGRYHYAMDAEPLILKMKENADY